MCDVIETKKLRHVKQMSFTFTLLIGVFYKLFVLCTPKIVTNCSWFVVPVGILASYKSKFFTSFLKNLYSGP